MSRVKPAASLLAAALLVASCTGRTGPGATSSASPTGSPSSTGSPSPTGSIELRGDDLGVVSFGEPMRVALRRLVELLGRPTDAQRMHGDLPLGYDGTNAIARWVSFGDLRLLFGDWAEFGEAGAMHLVGWDALGNRTTNGTVLATPEGIRVGSSVADLEAAYGSSLHLPKPNLSGCEGPPWYFGVDPEPLTFLGSLSGAPTDTGSHVGGLHAGSLREGVSVSECW